MRRALSRVALAAVIAGVTAVAAPAQQTSTSTETKSFEVLAVDGDRLFVRLPEGTRELTVPDDFRFMVNGQPLSLGQLKKGMKGTATVTTRTTVTPVTVTEVRNGTVMQRTGSSLIVRTPTGIRMFSQGDIDKRGVKIMREGKPAELSDFHQGDHLSATIITSMPPRVMTAKEVAATVPTATAEAASSRPAATAGSRPAPAAAAAPAPAPAPAPAAAAPTPSTTMPNAAPAATAGTGGRKLPKTASSWPIVGFASVLSIALGLALTIRRRSVS